MPRALAQLIILFMVPFGLYAGYLVAQLINPFELDRWTRRVVVPLALAGVSLAVVGLIVYGVLAGRYEGGYRPAHIENGRIVPGRMQ